MNQPELDKLLKKYYAGDSTPEEDKRMKYLLGSDSLSSHYTIEKEMFAAFEVGDGIPEPSNEFESNIMARIDAEEKGKRVIGLKRKFYSAVAVAASLLIIATSYFIIIKNGRPADTFTDPELAYIQVLETLKIVSDGMNTGKKQMADLAMIDIASENIGLIRKTSTGVAQQLESLGYINSSINFLESAVSSSNETR